MTQLTWAVVGTHLGTLALCLLVAAALGLRSRSAADLDHDNDDHFHHRVRHLHSTGSSFATGSDVKKMADVTSETVCLRLNGMHAFRGCPSSYLSDTSTTAISVTR